MRYEDLKSDLGTLIMTKIEPLTEELWKTLRVGDRVVNVKGGEYIYQVVETFPEYRFSVWEHGRQTGRTTYFHHFGQWTTNWVVERDGDSQTPEPRPVTPEPTPSTRLPRNLATGDLWNADCRRCGSPAYLGIGFYSMECSRRECK